MDNWRQYREIQYGEFFVVGGDCSAGGRDFSCCQFLSVTKNDVPLVYHTNKMATEMTNEIIPVLNKIFDVTGFAPVIAYERNNGGVYEMERLATLNRAGKFNLFHTRALGVDNPDNSQGNRIGWDTNSATRPVMLSALKDAVDKQVIKIYDKQTIGEMFSFVNVQTSASWKAQAEKNCHDDLVMSLAIAYQLSILCPKPKRVDYSQMQFEMGKRSYIQA